MARRFRFRLQTLLRVRELRQRESQRKVAAKRAELARLERIDEQTRAEIQAHQAALCDCQQQRTLDPAALARGRAWIAYLRGKIAERQPLRQKLVTELAALREELREARRQTRTIEKLRERRYDAYVRDRARREQAHSDELARQLHAAGQLGGG